MSQTDRVIFDPSDIEITRFGLREAPKAATLHCDVLYYSFNSRLGLNHLRHIYAVAASHAPTGVFGAVSGGRCIGVVCTTADAGGLIHEIMDAMRPGQWMQLAGRLALRPWLLVAWAKSRRLNRPVQWRGAKVAAELVAIAVLPGARGNGIGTRLIERAEEFLASQGTKAYFLSTRVVNEEARSFYHKTGFVELECRGRDLVLVKSLGL